MRKWLLVLSGAGLIVFSLVSMLLLEENGIGCRVIDAKRALKIEQQLHFQTDDMGFDLMFAEEELAYDSASKTFYLPLDRNTTLWEEGRIQATDGVDVFFLQDFTGQEKQKLMEENTAIPFYAVSGHKYGKYFLKITGLPVITFQGTDYVTENGEILYDFKLYESDTKADWVTRCYTTSTIRGNTSKSYEKKSLRLRLKEQKKDGSFEKTNKNLLSMRDDDDWILNSLYADNSRIRDKLAMDLWQETGAYENPYGQNFGITGEYVEIFINDNYTGLYLLTYPVDRKQLGLDSVSSQLLAGKEVVERIYKKSLSAPWQENDFVGNLPDPNRRDYRGGFYLKGDTILANEEEWEPLRKMAAVMEADDATFSAGIGELADVSNILDNWLFFQAIAGFDNENKNVYFVSRQKGGDSYGYFIPWDLNISFGAVYAENAFYCEETMKEVETLVAFQPGQRMVELDVADSHRLLKEKWESWRSSTFSTEQIHERMDTLQKTLMQSGALAREMERWPRGNASEDISLMREFTRQRLEFLDEYIAEMN